MDAAMSALGTCQMRPSNHAGKEHRYPTEVLDETAETG